MSRMYCGPSGRMIRKSRFVVNWMAANNNSNVRSLFGFTAQNPAFAPQRRRLVSAGLGWECFSSRPWKVARNRRPAKRGPAAIQPGVGALGGAQVHAADDGLHREGRLLPQSGGHGQFGRVALAVSQQVGFLPGTAPRPKPNSRSEECKTRGDC